MYFGRLRRVTFTSVTLSQVAGAWPSCVAFHAMHKSAGSTFVHVFSMANGIVGGKRYNCDNQEALGPPAGPKMPARRVTGGIGRLFLAKFSNSKI